MECSPPPFVLWLPMDLEGLVCFSFADGSMSEPFSSQSGGRTELLAAVQNEKVTVLQAGWLEPLIQKHSFSKPSLFSAVRASKPVLVRDIGIIEDADALLIGLSE